MKHWTTELPRKDEHVLEEAAIEQLVELLPGAAVTLDRNTVVGAVASAERIQGQARARAVLRFHEHDKDAEEALAKLESGELECGLNFSVSETRRALDGSHIKIGRVTRVEDVMLVVANSDPTYIDGKGTRTKELAAHAGDQPVADDGD